ncbi:Mix23 [Kluyveromyces lactis]|nr:Mix23 [Kluyveromyces lactis]
MVAELVINTYLPELEDVSKEKLLRKGITFDPNEKLVLNRERCVNPVLIDNFFRFLRHGSDDVLKQKLNNNKSEGSKDLNCNIFLNQMLYPNWKVRSEVISFCESELKSMKTEVNDKFGSENDSKPLVTERIDPYAVKDIISERESHYKDCSSLETWVNNQKDIERIIQIRTSSILSEQCGNDRDYIQEFQNFIKTRN